MTITNSAALNVSRRRFLQKMGVASGCFVLGATVPVGSWASTNNENNNQLNVFISIHENNQVDIICHRAEMGQGVRTSIPQIIADELEANWDLVTVVQGMANEAYGSQNTDGSTSIRNAFFQLRKIGASARYMLRQAAADFWQVPLAICQAENHQVKNTKTGKSLNYGQLAKLAANITPPKDDKIALKNESEYKYIGKGLTNVDLPDIVNGTTEYGQDIQLPGMLIASIYRCPVIGGKIKTFDDTLAKNVKGIVQILPIRHTDGAAAFNPLAGIAVLATNTYAALQGRKHLSVEWDYGPNRLHQSEAYLTERKSIVQQQGKIWRDKGNVENALKQYSDHINATYTIPYLAHASLEPPATSARINSDGTCEVWAATQAPIRARDQVAAALNIKKDKVKVHMTLLGGAFGRKAKPDYVVEAALLAKASGKPIKVVWSREDDIQNGYYHAISAQHYQGAFDDKKKIQAWIARTSFPSISSTFVEGTDHPSVFELSLGFADIPFAIDNIRCESAKAPAHLRIGWMRSVSNIHHGFAVGSFVDELAYHAGLDPKQFWLSLLGNNPNVDVNQGGFKYGNYGAKLEEHPINTIRIANVLKRVCDNASWGKTLPKGEGFGLSVHRSFLSYVAVVSHVKVTDKQLKVKKMYCVTDAGVIVNADRVKAQMEGAMIFGMSIALMNRISIKDGEVEQSNFHDYPIVRMNQAPEINIDIIQSNALPGGVGEPGVPPVMASIANAIFAATGERIRDLPVNQVYTV